MISEFQALQSLFDGMDCPFSVKNKYLRYIYVNQAFADLYGYDVGALTGKSANDLFQRDVAVQLENQDIELLETNGSLRQEEEISLPGGQVLWFSVLRQSVTFDSDKVFLVEIYTDISAQKQALFALEEQLLQHGASQALHAPLNEYDRVGVVPEASSAPVQRFIVFDADDEQRNLFSKQLQDLSVDCAACATAEEAFAVIWTAHDEGLNIDGIFIDFESLENHKVNIVHFIKSDDILCKVPICLMVPQAHLDQLERRKELLSVDARILKPVQAPILERTISKLMTATPEPFLKEGAENVASELVEQGESGAEAPMETLPASHPEIDAVICVENKLTRSAVSKILDIAGFSFKAVGDVQNALDVIGEAFPRTILLDMNMPAQDIRQFSSIVRTINDEGVFLPIIGLSAPSGKQMEMVQELGLDDYLSKPISPSGLISKLSGLIENDYEQKSASN